MLVELNIDKTTPRSLHVELNIDRTALRGVYVEISMKSRTKPASGNTGRTTLRSLHVETLTEQPYEACMWKY